LENLGIIYIEVAFDSPELPGVFHVVFIPPQRNETGLSEIRMNSGKYFIVNQQTMIVQCGLHPSFLFRKKVTTKKDIKQ